MSLLLDAYDQDLDNPSYQVSYDMLAIDLSGLEVLVYADYYLFQDGDIGELDSLLPTLVQQREYISNLKRSIEEVSPDIEENASLPEFSARTEILIVILVSCSCAIGIVGFIALSFVNKRLKK